MKILWDYIGAYSPSVDNTIFSKVSVSASTVHVLHLTLSSLCSSFPCQGQFSLPQTFYFTEICQKSKSPVFMYYLNSNPIKYYQNIGVKIQANSRKVSN